MSGGHDWCRDTAERTLDQAVAAAETASLAANSPATGPRSITGTPVEGQTLRANITGISDSDGMTNATFTYQWLADDAEINGATGSSSTLVAGNPGKSFKVRGTFTDDAGNEASLPSNLVAAQSQVITEPLAASIHSAPGSHDGSAAFTFELRCSQEPASGLSHTKMRDHALTVTGGIGVQGAEVGAETRE